MSASSMKTIFLWILAVAVGLVFAVAPASAADKKPNILLIVSDNHG